ncbi:DapH/DapD/GlmU-related protein [Herbaspirillum seropedicae]|uniref:DapH/DapD/GlmU-related protein n=1 Tax=Herbaspirillum seropedicae TaxID=964 RepID=UPI003D96B48F
MEEGVILKGPAIIGPGVFIGAHAYIRGGNWIHERCSIGHGCELKSSFVFAESRLAHFNFVGDSIIGRDVNLEAGSIICNHRNERVHKTIYVRADGIRLNTGIEKFGTLIGDHSRLGANSVIAPGTLIQPSTVIERGALRDDDATEI